MIKPKYSRRTGTASFSQVVYKSRNGSSWKPSFTVPLAANGIFDPPSDYRYPLTQFTLNVMNGDGSPGAVVATSPKTDYCITADAFVGGVPNAPNKTSPPQSDCTKPNTPLGFSVGWGDQYDQTDNGQPIDLRGVSDGTYILHAVVDPDHLFTESDPTNNVVDTELQIASGTVTVFNQTGPHAQVPAVELSSPGSGSNVSGTVALRASAKAVAPAAVASVQFLLDGQPLGPSGVLSSSTYAWTVGTTSPGLHALSARVTDSHGRVATAPVRTIDVVAHRQVHLAGAADPAPDVMLVNPVSQQAVSGTVPVAANVHDDVGVQSVQFTLDGNRLGAPVTAAPYAVKWNTRRLADGPHVLSAQATNASGIQAKASDVAVNVENPAAPMTCFVLDVHVIARGNRTVMTPSFHTAVAGETLLAFVAGNGPEAGPKPTATVRGAGLHWKLVKRADTGTGDAEIWSARAPTVLTSARVTSTVTKWGFHQQLTVTGIQGIAAAGASSAATGTGGGPTLALRTARPTTLVFAVADACGAVGPTLPAGWVNFEPVDRRSRPRRLLEPVHQPTDQRGGNDGDGEGHRPRRWTVEHGRRAAGRRRRLGDHSRRSGSHGAPDLHSEGAHDLVDRMRSEPEAPPHAGSLSCLPQQR